jgi:predicted methyltransferase
VRRALLAVAIGATALLPAAAQTPGNHGRLFPPQDLGLLEAPDRDQWQRPDQIMDALGIAEASVVADLGAGSGWFTVRLARRVGPNGLVYAQDVQPEMLAAISRRVQREGMRNVRVRLGRGSDPRLPARTFDAIVMVEVAHQIDDRVALFRALRTALKPQGRLGVIDYRLNGGGPGPDLDERVDPDLIVKEAEQGGLEWKRSESFLPYQYFLVFGVPPATTTQMV